MVDKISRTTPVTPSAGTVAGQYGHNARNPEPDADDDGGQEEDSQRELAAVELRGIPAADLSPDAQQAFIKLMQDFDRLRNEVHWGRDRVRQLEKLSDQHDFLPMLNRRAFLRKLDDALSLRGHLSTGFSLLLLHVGIGDAVRRSLGVRAHAELMDHLAGILAAIVHPTDITGSLGGHDFGILLVVGDPKTAEAKRRVIIEAINRSPFEWDGKDYHLKPLSGVVVLDHPESALDALWEADRDLLQRAAGAARDHQGKKD